MRKNKIFLFLFLLTAILFLSINNSKVQAHGTCGEGQCGFAGNQTCAPSQTCTDFRDDWAACKSDAHCTAVSTPTIPPVPQPPTRTPTPITNPPSAPTPTSPPSVSTPIPTAPAGPSPTQIPGGIASSPTPCPGCPTPTPIPPTPTIVPRLPPCLDWGIWDQDKKEYTHRDNIKDFQEPDGTFKADVNVNCIKFDTAIGEINPSPKTFVARIFGLVLGLSAGISLILIILSGYKFMTSGANQESYEAARSMLASAIVGLLFIIFSFVILQIIGVDILRIPGFER